MKNIHELPNTPVNHILSSHRPKTGPANQSPLPPFSKAPLIQSVT